MSLNNNVSSYQSVNRQADTGEVAIQTPAASGAGIPSDNGRPDGFYRQLVAATATEREKLLSGPLVARALNGQITLAEYRAFLAQAYHHVRHTVSLMMACGAQLSEPAHVSRDALRMAVAEYIDEEQGHEHWVLDDLAATGVPRERAVQRAPLLATELMVAYAYDSIRRRHPLSMFGMVLVLEGTSTAVASGAGRAVRDSLGLGDDAFHYLFSHGELDISHMEFFANLMDSITDEGEQQAIIHAAKAFYHLYSSVHQAALEDAFHWTDAALAADCAMEKEALA